MLRKLIIYTLLTLTVIVIPLYISHFGGFSELASSKIFHPLKIDSLKTIAQKNGISSFWIESLNDSVLLRDKIVEKKRILREIKEQEDQLLKLESDVHNIETIISLESSKLPNYSLDFTENIIGIIIYREFHLKDSFIYI